MTPKEKAIELIDKMYDAMDIQDGDLWKSTKQCALIAVDEILNELDSIRDITGSSFVLGVIDYWQEVKQEIELL